MQDDTKQAVAETICICKNKNVLSEYLDSREKEVVTIMMSLFDEEQIMRVYTEDIKKETSIEKMSDFFPELTDEEVKEIEIMQTA